jgi:hypothetical protein
MTRILHDRLIAFIDVLGFSEKLRTQELEKLHGEYAEFIDQARNKTFYKSDGDNTGRTNFEFSQFLFDSIVVVSNPVNDVYNVNSFVTAIQFLLELGFQTGLPLRGVISRGDFLLDDARNIFLSSRFPDIVSCEKQIEMVGCICLPETEDIVLQSIFGNANIRTQEQICNQLVHFFDIPLKKSPKVKLLVINFLLFTPRLKIASGLSKLIEPKKSNTEEYLNFLRGLQMHYQNLTDEFLPAVKAVCIQTRSGVRIQFWDEFGQQCTPSVDTIEVKTEGRWY